MAGSFQQVNSSKVSRKTPMNASVLLSCERSTKNIRLAQSKQSTNLKTSQQIKKPDTRCAYPDNLILLSLCCTLRKKESVFGVILARIFPAFSRISGPHFSRILPHLNWENAGKMRTRITPNTDSFCAVVVIAFHKKT